MTFSAYSKPRGDDFNDSAGMGDGAVACRSVGASSTLLEVIDLSTHFRTESGVLVRAVDRVTFSLDLGETLGIVGESGSGKSVLAKSVMHLLPDNAIASGGEVVFDGVSLRDLNPKRLRRIWGADIAMIFQDPMGSLNPVRRVGRQISDTLRNHSGLTRKEAWERSIELLRSMGIPDAEERVTHYPGQFSGGMQQRIMIAIATACRPRLLLADEPTTALDVTIQRQILDLIAEQQRAYKMSMILISHDLSIVRGRTHRTMVMYGGQIVEMGPTARLLAAPRHPYTDALIGSAPNLDDPPHTRLQVIPGHATSHLGVETGCRFAPRCALAQPNCLVDSPPLVPGETTGSVVRCFHPVGTDAGRAALARNVAGGTTAAGLPVRQTLDRA